MNMEKKWYMVTTIRGKEEKVVESLNNRIISESLQEVIGEIKLYIIPHFTPSGKFKKKNLFPGYIFVEMVMTNDAWFIVRNTQYVTGLIGSSGQRTKPTPVSLLELKKINRKCEKIWQDYKEGKLEPEVFKKGEIIEVISGSMKGLKGPLIKYSKEKMTVTVDLTLFDRKTPTELKFEEVEKENA
ncbi:MAG: transcription termination/antitermination protein NusG [Mycoplasma sp.]|nr:transcription termination/antitermination protein NusG [Mycoplasma sp.]